MRRSVAALLAFALIAGCRGLLGIDDDRPLLADGGASSDGSANTNNDGSSSGKDGETATDAISGGDTAAPGSLDARYALWTTAPDHPDPATTYSIIASGNVVVDSSTGLSWEAIATTTAQSYDAAKTYCSTLEYGYPAGSWRMPTRIEMLTIADYEPSPLINTQIFMGPTETDYWTLSVVPGNDTKVFAFNPNSEYPNDLIDEIAPPSQTQYVRCVHGGAPLPSSWNAPLPNGLFLSGNYGVTDSSTHLLWEQNASTTMMTLSDASAYCAGVSPAARMPTIREASTLTDESVQKQDPVWPSLFTGTSGEYWTASSWAADPSYEWTWVTNGEVDIMHPTQLAYVRCVAPN